MKKNTHNRNSKSRYALFARNRTASTAHRPLSPAHSRRRGILLLVALSLLVLFLLVGTAFVVTARHSSRTAITVSKANRIQSTEAGQADLLDNVLKQIVRDTNNPNSSLRNHSLLRDMYGNDGFVGFVPARTTDNTGNYVDANGTIRIPRPTNGTNGPAFPHTDKDGFVARWAPTRFLGSAGANKHLIQQSNITRGQIIEIDVLDVEDLFGNSDRAFNALKQIPDAYNGLALTFTSGAADGVTTRIIDYIPPQPDDSGTDEDYPRDFARFRLLSFRQADGNTLPQNDIDLNTLLAGSRFVVNGRPFNGTGVGFDKNEDAGDARLDAEEEVNGTDYELALMPNTVFFDPASVTITSGGPVDYFPPSPSGVTADSPYSGLGGSDESYDAADFQNMLMGLMPKAPIETTWPNLTGTAPGSLGDMVLPSLHRPALINFHNGPGTPGNLEFNPMLLRKVTLRPSWFDHPNFTGSNPDLSAASGLFANAFDQVVIQGGNDLTALRGNTNAQDGTRALVNHSIYGPWDVDNDNDGVRDSVWVDFGAPVMSMPDGTLVKPLAAVLCIDLDGRLNVNAHGSPELAVPWNPGTPQPVAGTGNTTNNLPQGQGYGPADISLSPLFSNIVPHLRVLGGSNGINNNATWNGPYLPGRYGEDRGAPAYNFTETMPGVRVYHELDGPGSWNQEDIKTQLSTQGMPRVFSGAAARSAFGSPPDLKGRYALGINDFGQPVYEMTAEATTGQRSMLNLDSPYELNLFNTTGQHSNSEDAPYTLAELERILRAYDVDAAAAPDRLATLGEFLDSNNLQQARNLITTESWDLPVPSGNLPSWVNETDPMKLDLDNDDMTQDDFQTVMGRPAVGASFADLIEYRYRAITPNKRFGSVTANILPPLTAAERRAIANLIPRDLASGTKLDINRALGNGRDDNNNGVVDEPGEVDGAYWRLERGQAATAVAVDMNLADGDPANEFVRVDPAPNNRNDRNLSPGLARDFHDGFGGAPVDGSFDTNGDGVVNVSDNEVRDMSRTGNNAADVAYRVRWDNLRRQELAKDLYITALALVDPFASQSTVQQEAYRAKCRRIAQWAVNVVDYRDADSAMTPFKYDVNPFDGWNVNQDEKDNTDIRGDDNRLMSSDDTGGLVWGVERPELLITEVVAWHDRATTNESNEDVELRDDAPNDTDPDVALDGPNSGTDSDFDQQVRPQGACFIELYNPHPQNPAASADVHAFAGTTHVGVNLAKLDPTGTTPVWRIAVGLPPDPQGTTGQDFLLRSYEVSPDNPHPNMRPAAVERTVYFTGFDPGHNDGSVAYHNDINNPVPSVRPGRYMVVGSGVEINAGVYESRMGVMNDGSPGTRKVILRPQDVTDPFEYNDPDNAGRSLGSRNDPAAIDGRTTIVDVAVINQVRDRRAGANPNDQRTVKFTISEPVPTAAHPEGYPIRYEPGGAAVGVEWDPNFNDPAVTQGIPGAYVDGGGVAKPIDIPLDDNPTFPGGIGPGIGRRDAHRWIYLQRLANPQLPWNPPAGEPGHDPALPFANPYLTIDHSPASVTVFNGKMRDTQHEIDPNFTNEEAANEFLTTERGWKNNPAQPLMNGTVVKNLWNPEFPVQDGDNFRPQPIEGGGDHRFDCQPHFTLGDMNEPFRTNPNIAFSWLNWNNRPYISANELMQVPCVDSASLLRLASMPDQLQAVEQKEAYERDPRNVKRAAESYDRIVSDGPYSHLLNFFRAETDSSGMKNWTIAGMHRVLDYLHVPSRYVGTEQWLNPVAFNGIMTDSDDPRNSFQVPFNKVSSFREPGQVNLNSMSHQAIYFGLMHGDTNPQGTTPQAHPGPTWLSQVDSRRGYGTSNQPMLQLDSQHPTFFANPYRASDAGDLVPTSELLGEGVQATMLRSEDIDPDAAPTMPPLFAALTQQAYNDSERNSYFRYEPTTRLDNLTTTRSNVYAVWVTVGFFEVEAAPTLEQFRLVNDPSGTLTNLQVQALYERVYPEGYQLGREYGIDVGETRRLRGFSIVDRSIPVGFEPGYDHNSNDVVRLQRQVE